MRRTIAASFVLLLIGILPAKSFSNDRPSQCPQRLWCGCWLADYLGIRDAKLFHELWAARRWASYGQRASGPAPGVIAVFARGRGGHVGIITSVPRRGVVVLKSGNDDGAVRERERPIKNVIAWRYP